MALELDTSRQLRSVSELRNLVRAISGAPSTESEPDWLEWKSGVDLTERKWHARIAKFIAGFANRDPAVAKLQAGGCGYLVIGAEPGSVVGVSPVDNAELHDGTSRYIGKNARWNPQYVDHDEQQVLVITVEPPEFGDRITAILRQYTDQAGTTECREGDVYIRRAGKTERATQGDYDALVERFATSEGQIDGVRIDVAEPATATPIAFGATQVLAWRELQERVLLEPLAHTRNRTFPDLSYAFESRTPEQYREEVESYLAEAVQVLPNKARSDAILEFAPSIRLVLRNDTEDNFAAVRVTLSIKDELQAYSDEWALRPEMPIAPDAWESGMLMVANHLAIPSPVSGRIPQPLIDNSVPLRIVFPDIDLRPGESIELDPIWLVAEAKLSGQTLTGEWTATTTSRSGMAHGPVPIAVASEALSVQVDSVES